MQTKQIQKELVNGVDVPKLTQIIDELTQNLTWLNSIFVQGITGSAGVKTKQL